MKNINENIINLIRGDGYIIYPPSMEDLHIIASKNGFRIKTYYLDNGKYVINIYGKGKNKEIKYNPMLPLLQQDDKTKQEIINFISNPDLLTNN